MIFKLKSRRQSLMWHDLERGPCLAQVAAQDHDFSMQNGRLPADRVITNRLGELNCQFSSLPLREIIKHMHLRQQQVNR